jgi:glutathione S-transferase
VIRLYTIPLSHPSLTAEAALRQKGLEHRVVSLLAGAHPLALRALGFRSWTVPAMRLGDGRRVQGSLEITRTLEELAPAPSLYPADPQARQTAQDAERWGEEVLQPVPRRLIRWGLGHHLSQRRWFARVATPLPAPWIMGIALTPVVPAFVAQAGARDDRVRQDLVELPGLLDEVDRLIAAGVIGCERPGAADFQIGASVRMLLAFEDLAEVFEGRPAQAFARTAFPDYPAVPAALPAEWLASCSPIA